MSCSNVVLDGKVVSNDSMCMSYSCSSIYRDRVVGERAHASADKWVRCWAPSYLRAIHYIRPRYMVPSCHGSSRASRSWSPGQVEYLKGREDELIPKSLWGSRISMLRALLGRQHMALVVTISNLSRIWMYGFEYGTT